MRKSFRNAYICRNLYLSVNFAINKSCFGCSFSMEFLHGPIPRKQLSGSITTTNLAILHTYRFKCWRKALKTSLELFWYDWGYIDIRSPNCGADTTPKTAGVSSSCLNLVAHHQKTKTWLSAWKKKMFPELPSV